MKRKRSRLPPSGRTLKRSRNMTRNRNSKRRAPAEGQAEQACNPFSVFTEWYGDADEKAYAKL